MTLYKAKQFSVDSNGAYLTRLVDVEGRPILFERTEIDGKRRGGSHVCFPYFGADAAGILPQHGFGRDVEWKVTVGADGTEIACSYMKRDEEGLFEGLSANILYKLHPKDNEFFVGLTVSNPFPHTGPQPVSPGFHPYFAVDPTDLRLGGEKINIADFEPYREYPNTNSMTIASGGRIVTVSSSDLQHMVVWSDAKGEYLCVEPTLSGHSFDSTKLGSSVLEATTHVQYGFTIKWS